MRLRERIIRRDSFQCQRCMRTDRRLEAHHRIAQADWPKDEQGRYKPGLHAEDQLISLCVPCHVLTHCGNPPTEEYLRQRQSWRDYVKALQWQT